MVRKKIVAETWIREGGGGVDGCPTCPWFFFSCLSSIPPAAEAAHVSFPHSLDF